MSLSGADPAEVVAEARRTLERIEALPGEMPETISVSLFADRADDGSAHLFLARLPGDRDATALLDMAVSGPCDDVSLSRKATFEDDSADLDDDGVLSMLRKDCSVDGTTMASVVDALPGKTELPETEEVPDSVTVQLKTEPSSMTAVVQGEVEPERAEGFAQLSALTDAVGMTQVRLESPDPDRISVSGAVAADQTDVGKELMAIMRPLDLRTAEVTRKGVDSEGQSEPLLHLVE